MTDPDNDMRRRSILVPDRLWYAAQASAAEESRITGEAVSVSEYFRRAVDERLQRKERDDGE